tara:strand:+ start:2856 stop:3437 length:582 start_codon:yes stop_codon:yes gene_type:complete
MAAATTIALVGAGVGILAGGAQAVSGAVRAKRAKRDLENYERQEVTDLADNLRVSTLGAEQQQEGLAQSESTAVEALQASGARGVIGGVSGVQKNRAQAEQGIAAGLDQQMTNIEQTKYQDKVRQFNTTEGRQNQDIAGMAAEMQAGRAAVQQGLGTIAGAATSGASSYATAMGGGGGGGGGNKVDVKLKGTG